jgi:hypothetical protein
MIFPNLNLWTSASAKSAADSIDRSLQNRQHRLIAGMSIDSHFEKVHGCLAVIQGQGKFAKLKHAIGSCQPVPQSIARACVDAVQNPKIATTDLALLLHDLAEVQAMVVEQLKLQAGKYVDRILAVAVADPGIWSSDFDGRPCCQSMCDASTLAEISGVNVIDDLPARDLSVGGSGRPLSPLPVWILFADRNPKVSCTDCSFIDGSKPETEIFTLPASDGLDAELPTIGWQVATAGEAIQQTLDRIEKANPNDRIIVAPTLAGKNSSQLASQGNLNSRIEFFGDVVGEEIDFQALVSALLGMFHIDQMPANIPAITGANSQRILGRLTPGRPSTWRQLIRAMAQHQPAPMKLKDAV